MHQALYRKWRPRTFDDVCGQEHITSVLRFEVAKGTPSHAYLFCGSRGTGKTTCAKILAKAVNCLSPENGNPCGKCAACLSVENGSATDVLEMDAASNNGVENIRDIRDEVIYTPTALKYRVYIVDEVHMLSASAFNALLKTLEEPPAHVIFILATTELQKLPATIVSRCQRFDFRRIATPVLSQRISFIAREEGIRLDPDAADRISRMAQGGMRDAISLLELCAGGGRPITTETVNEMMGSVGREGMIRVIEGVANADYDAVFGAVAEAVNASRDLAVFWQDLIGVYRDLLVIKTTDAAASYLDLADGEAQALSALAARFSKGGLLAQCRLVEDALFAMQKSSAAKRMIAELTLVRMCDPALDTSPEGLLARIERLEDALSGGVSVAPSVDQKTVAPSAPSCPDAEDPTLQAAAVKPRAAEPTPCPTAASASQSSPSAVAPVGGGRVLTRMRGFVNAVERVRRENAMAASFLEGARAFTDEGGGVVIRLPSAFAEMMLEGQGGRDLLRRALSAELKREVRDRALQIEVEDGKVGKNDTVLDDILNAAGENA
ncbi:MAG: DNA polymerase III subunit gamma/tau [Ruminococcaceae bacterium]|nr:DNA polymerase III subunit gamma/tau [Oscillospiraceae bacterium]